MGPRRVGIKDVAQRAGVSWKTVSNVMHERPNVATATRERVLAAVSELGYHPNRTAQQLQSGRTGVISLVLPDITSSYFGALAARIIAGARDRGYVVAIRETGGDPERELDAVHGDAAHTADGLIMLALTTPSAEVADAADLPTVMIGQREPELAPNQVVIDNLVSAREATRHLLDQGRTRLAFLGATELGYGSGWVRQQGFLNELAEAGLEPAALVRSGPFTRANGAEATAAVLAEGIEIDGWVCAVDALAIGALFALRRAGRRVPQDVAVLGWDNLEEGAFANPTLTTVAPDIDAVARETLDGLLGLIDGGDDFDARVVGHRLIVRESSGGSA